MRATRGSERPLSEVYRYSGLGCMFAAAVLVFMAGGWALDRWLGTLPVFTVLAALVGAALATVNVYRRLMGGDDA
ncbi:MAG: AtpZ/AtpI family protein [Gemmatimonadota bacterium]|nr:AtpZ/AtpI family protein [Gemmatimonadota bacterium]